VYAAFWHFVHAVYICNSTGITARFPWELKTPRWHRVFC